MYTLPFSFASTIVHGEKIGRQIGFPTANFAATPREEDLEKGVHFGFCEIEGKKYSCLSYFGPRLVFGEVKNCFEVFIYDFAGDLYDSKLEVTLTDFLRQPMHFDGLPSLTAQLEKDKAAGEALRTTP
jgi:riboflavin kinase/FMN adenylyltransferase